jgi:hypothetical protein
MNKSHRQSPSPTTTGSGASMNAIIQDRNGTDPEAVLRFGETDRPTVDDTDTLAARS